MVALLSVVCGNEQLGPSSLSASCHFCQILHRCDWVTPAFWSAAFFLYLEPKLQDVLMMSSTGAGALLRSEKELNGKIGQRYVGTLHAIMQFPTPNSP